MTCTEKIAEGTYRLEARIPGLSTLFTVYFVREKDDFAIIEPGPAAVIPAIQAGLKELGLGAPRYVIPTHIHLDHAGGVGKLSEMFPDAKVVVAEEGARHIIDPSRLIRSTGMAFGADFQQTYGNILPVPEARVKVARDLEILTIGDRELQFIKTPGHAPHHMAIFDRKTRGLFSGEALGLIYEPGKPPLPAVAVPNLDTDIYLENMERLRKLKPRLIFYSHGGAGTDPDALITAAEENTRLVNETIRRLLEQGKTEPEITRATGQLFRERFGIELDEYDLESNVKGFIFYRHKKGIGEKP